MFFIDKKKLHNMLDDAIYHLDMVEPNRESLLTPDNGALIRDLGKDKALKTLQARRSLGRFSFLENLSDCLIELDSPFRRRIK